MRGHGGTVPSLLRILFVNDVVSLGGAQTAMADVMGLLTAAGYELHLASPEGDLARRAVAGGATWHPFEFRDRQLLGTRHRVPRPRALVRRASEGARLRRLASELGVALVHSGAQIPHLDLALSPRRNGPRALWHLHQVPPPLLFAGSLPDRIVSVSHAALWPGRWRRAVARRAVVLPNGIDLERFRPPGEDERRAARSALEVEGFTVVTVARLEPLKGVDTVIEAVSRCGVPVTLVVVGDSTGFAGGDRHEHELRARARGAGLDVRFLGARADVARLLWAADAFAYGSRWDSLPYVLVEAAASGLPVVSTDVGGCGEVVEDRVSGILVPVDDPGAMARELTAIAQDPDLRRRLGAAARRRAEVHFDRRELAGRFLDIYTELIGQP